MYFELIQSYFIPPTKSRRKENEYALQKNLENPYIDNIHLFFLNLEDDTKEKYPYLNHPKIHLYPRKNRQTYELFIEFGNKILTNKNIIIANTDIWFDATLNLIKNKHLENNTMIALTRYESSENYAFHDWAGCCHDTWIFKSPIKPFNSDISMGILGCDSMLHINALKGGITLKCPSLDVKSYHEHSDLDHNSNTRNNRLADGKCYWDHSEWFDFRLHSTHLEK